MIAILKKPLQKFSKSLLDVEHEVPEGYMLTVVNPAFIPKWIQEEFGHYSMQKVKTGEYFAFMYQLGVWFVVSRDDCEIPIDNGWKYNI